MTKQQEKTCAVFYENFLTSKQLCEKAGISKQALNRDINTQKISKPFILSSGGGGLGLWLKDDAEVKSYIVMRLERSKKKV